MSKEKKIKSYKSLADELVEEAKKQSNTLEGQLEILRFWRDVNARGNFKAQLA